MENYLISFSTMKDGSTPSQEYCFTPEIKGLPTDYSSAKNHIWRLIEAYKKMLKIKGKTDSGSINWRVLKKLVIADLSSLGINVTLNLMKVNGEIVHISSDDIKLLQTPSTSKVLIPFSNQTPINKNGTFFMPLSLNNAHSYEFEECSIKEASSFYNMPEEKFKAIDLDSFKS